MARKRGCYSGIGGQAVLEGVMMKNDEKYAVAVRKPDGNIEVEMENFQSIVREKSINKIPFVRGIFNFIDSLILGMRCLNYSASFYEEDEEPTFIDKALEKVFKRRTEKVISLVVTTLSMIIAIGIFIVLPYFLSSQLERFIRNDYLMAVIEGSIRIAIFVLYILGISMMSDIKRLFSYHGAEHKCINCIEHGKMLTVKNAMKSSRLHKRCGTSFIFFVLFVSIILFFFINVENTFQKVALRILLMPVIAGISYELIRLAGRGNGIFVKIISAPGMLIQKLTTKEPDESMIEVAIASVEAVFDWKQFLKDKFGYVDEDFEVMDSEFVAEETEEPSSEEFYFDADEEDDFESLEKEFSGEDL